MSSTSPSSTPITDHLKQLYAAYRATQDIDAKGAFFSPTCRQVCRPQPAYAARDRATIVRYLHEAAAASSGDAGVMTGLYTIRPLRAAEREIGGGDDDVVRPAGFGSAAEALGAAEREGWVGMRVDLWDAVAPPEGEKEKGEGRLVKVQYWWRKEGDAWMQIMHDIMYIGPRDGSEGREGEALR